MPKCTLTEDEIIRGLRSDDDEIKIRTEIALFTDDEVNRSVKGHVQNHDGTWHQAQAVFAYAFETFTSKVRLGTYPKMKIEETNWRTYLSNIGYRAWV